jgi:hypothetical protein
MASTTLPDHKGIPARRLPRDIACAATGAVKRRNSPHSKAFSAMETEPDRIATPRRVPQVPKVTHFVAA